jgi:hypothetical protein
MSRTSYHVIPSPNGGWSVKKERVLRASKHFDTQADAIDWAKRASKTEGGEFVVHGKDGTIRIRDTFGRDPYPSRGLARE